MNRSSKTLHFTFLLPILLTMILSEAIAQTESSLQGLIAAERAFARAAADSSMKQAFLAFLDDDGVVFRPEASNGKETWSAAPDGSRALLSWDPAWAEVSADGSLGYTTGPWTFRQTPEDSVVASGTYISVWRKNSAGEWKVMADLGIGHEPLVDNSDLVETSIEPRSVPSEISSLESEKALFHSLEVETSAAATTSGYSRAVNALIPSDARFYRNGELPILGLDAVLERLGRESGRMGWQVSGWDIAASGDIAYSWGIYRTVPDKDGDAMKGNYLRVWRRSGDGKWKIALEVMAPLR